METNGSNANRWSSYRSGRRLSLVTGATLSVVALMMMIAPTALGATFHAPYTGLVTANDYASHYGCASERGTLGFALATGISSGSASASAKSCPKVLGQTGAYSNANNEPSIDASVKVKLPTGVHHVAVNWAINAAIKGSEAFGACPPPTHFKDTYTYHYGSYYSWDNSTGASGYCSAETSVYGDLYAYLQDVTTGQTYNGTYHSIADSYMESYNDSYWECTNDTIWNGTAYSYSHGCYGYNSTLKTYAYLNGVYYSSWTGATIFNNTTSSVFTMYSNQTFVGTHHYILFFEIYIEAYAFTERWHALVSSSFNIAGAGNGASLVKIVVT